MFLFLIILFFFSSNFSTLPGACEEQTASDTITKLLYGNENTLRPLPEITSHLLADRSLMHASDNQGNTLLHHLFHSSKPFTQEASLLTHFILNNGDTPILHHRNSAGDKPYNTLLHAYSKLINKGSALSSPIKEENDHSFTKILQCILKADATALTILDDHRNHEKDKIKHSLSLMAQAGNKTGCDYLLNWHTPSDEHLSGEALEEALEVAVITGHEKIVSTLLRREIIGKKTYPEETLKTLFFKAAYYNHLPVINALFSEAQFLEASKKAQPLIPLIKLMNKYTASDLLHFAPSNNVPLSYSPSFLEKAIQGASQAGHIKLTTHLITHHLHPAHALSKAIEQVIKGENNNMRVALLEEESLQPFVLDALSHILNRASTLNQDDFLLYCLTRFPLSDPSFHLSLKAALTGALAAKKYDLFDRLLKYSSDQSDMLISLLDAALEEDSSSTMLSHLVRSFSFTTSTIETILYKAIHYGNESALYFLLQYVTSQASYDPSHTHSLLSALVDTALIENKTKLLSLLVEQWESLTGAPITQELLCTFFQKALEVTSYEGALFLSTWGQDHGFFTPSHTLINALLEAASQNKNEEIERILFYYLQRSKNHPLVPNMQDLIEEMRTTPLALPCFFRSGVKVSCLPFLKALLEKEEADPFFINEKLLLEGIHIALTDKNTDILLFLLEHPVSQKTISFTDLFPLVFPYTVKHFHQSLFFSFLEKAHHCPEKENLKNTLILALDEAIMHHNDPAIESILSQWENIINEELDDVIVTPLLWKAAAYGRSHVVAYCVQLKESYESIFLLSSIGSAIAVASCHHHHVIARNLLEHYPLALPFIPHTPHASLKAMVGTDYLAAFKKALKEEAHKDHFNCKEALISSTTNGHFEITKEILQWSFDTHQVLPENLIEKVLTHTLLNAQDTLTSLLLSHYPPFFPKTLYSAVHLGKSSLVNDILKWAATHSFITPAIIEESLVSASMNGNIPVGETIIRWSNNQRLFISEETIQKCLQEAVNRMHHDFILWLLPRYPHLLRSTLKTAVLLNDTYLVNQLTRHDPIQIAAIVNNLANELMQMPECLLRANYALLILLSLRDNEGRLLTPDILLQTLRTAIYLKDKEYFTSFITAAPELAPQVLQYAIENDYLPIIIYYLSPSFPTPEAFSRSTVERAFIFLSHSPYKNSHRHYLDTVNAFLEWKSPSNEHISPEVIREVFLIAAQTQNLFLIKTLLKKYSVLKTRIKQRILLKKFPELVTKNIMEFDSFLEREISLKLIEQALALAYNERRSDTASHLLYHLLCIEVPPLDEVLTLSFLNRYATLISFPLHYACKTNNAPLLEKFLSLPNFPSLPNLSINGHDDFHQALMVSVAHSNMPVVLRLLQHKPMTVKSALYFACFYGQTKIINHLLSNTFPLEKHLTQSAIENALIAACEGSQSEAVSSLLSYSAQKHYHLSMQTLEKAVLTGAQKGNTDNHALIAQILEWIKTYHSKLSPEAEHISVSNAAYNGCSGITTFLLSQFPHHLSIAFQEAAHGGHSQLLTHLLQYSAHNGKKICAADVEKALIAAASKGHTSVVMQLLEWKGAEAEQVSYEAITCAITQAARYTYKELTEALLKRYPELQEEAFKSAVYYLKPTFATACLVWDNHTTGSLPLSALPETILEQVTTKDMNEFLALPFMTEQQTSNLSLLNFAAYKGNSTLTLTLLQSHPTPVEKVFLCASYGGHNDLLNQIRTWYCPSGEHLSPFLLEKSLLYAALGGKESTVILITDWLTEQNTPPSLTLIKKVVHAAAQANRTKLVFSLLKKHPKAFIDALEGALLKPVRYYHFIKMLLKKRATSGSLFDISTITNLCTSALLQGKNEVVIRLLSFVKRFNTSYTPSTTELLCENVIKKAAFAGSSSVVTHLLDQHPHLFPHACQYALYGNKEEMLRFLLTHYDKALCTTELAMLLKKLLTSILYQGNPRLVPWVLEYVNNSTYLSEKDKEHIMENLAQKLVYLKKEALINELFTLYPQLHSPVLRSAGEIGWSTLINQYLHPSFDPTPFMTLSLIKEILYAAANANTGYPRLSSDTIRSLLKWKDMQKRSLDREAVEEALQRSLEYGRIHNNDFIEILASWTSPSGESIDPLLMEKAITAVAQRGTTSSTFSLLAKHPDFPLKAALRGATQGGKTKLLSKLLDSYSYAIDDSMLTHLLKIAAQANHITTVKELLSWSKLHQKDIYSYHVHTIITNLSTTTPISLEIKALLKDYLAQKNTCNVM